MIQPCRCDRVNNVVTPSTVLRKHRESDMLYGVMQYRYCLEHSLELWSPSLIVTPLTHIKCLCNSKAYMHASIHIPFTRCR